MKKPTSKRILTPGRTKQAPKISSTRDDKPNEILPASNKIIPVNKKSGNIVLNMAKLSTKAAVTALKLTKGTLKSSVDLLAGQFITSQQIVGKWKLVQEVEEKNGGVITSPVSLQFYRDGTVKATVDGIEHISEYSFRERSWPRHCTVQFEAMIPQLTAVSDSKKKGNGGGIMSLRPPAKLIYRGVLKKSVFDKGVLRMTGSIYRPSGRLFWKGFERCGQFRATLRKTPTTSTRSISRDL